MNCLSWRGIPLKWRLDVVRNESREHQFPILDSWRRKTGLIDSGTWRQRLAAAGTSSAHFAAALAADPPGDFEAQLARSQPEFCRFAEAISNLQRRLPAMLEQKSGPHPLSSLIRILLEGHYRSGSGPAEGFEKSPHDIEVLAAGILDALVDRFGDLIDTEYEAMKAAGIIEGTTPETSRKHKLQRIAETDDVIEYLVGEYPTLVYHLYSFARYCLNVSTSFLPVSNKESRVALARAAMVADGEDLAGTMLGTRFDTIGGDLSLELRTNHGSTWRNVDREAANVRWFLAMAEWLEVRGIDLGAGNYRFSDNATSGWLKIRPDDFASTDANPHDALFRFGALAAVCYVAGSHHMTHEAVAMWNDYPVLNRLDTLFSNGSLKATGSGGRSVAAPTYSVMSSSLLPRWRCNSSGKPTSSNMGLLARILSNRTVESRNRRSAPDADPLACRTADEELVATNPRTLESIVAGFTKCYRCLMEEREELLSSKWFCSETYGTTGRVILQDGWRYGVLGRKLREPTLLAEAMRTDTALEALWLGAGTKTPDAVVQYEVDSLWRGLCPQYWSSANGTNLCDQNGSLLVDDYFNTSIVNGIAERTNLLSASDMKRQVCNLVQSCSVFGSRPGFSPTDWTKFWRDAGILSVDEEESTIPVGRAARYARDVLVAGAPGSDRDNWLGVSQDNEDNWQLGGIPHGLTSGLDGIGLFLLYYHRSTGDPESRIATQTILDSAADRLTQTGAKNHPPTDRSLEIHRPPLSCAFLLAHSVRCGMQGSETEALLHHFWKRALKSTYVCDPSGNPAMLAHTLRAITDIHDCSASEWSLAMIERDASLLLQRTGGSVNNLDWNAWFPECFVALSAADAVLDEPKFRDAVVNLETALIARLEDLEDGTGDAAAMCDRENCMAVAQAILVGIASTCSDPDRDQRNKIRRGIERHFHITDTEWATRTSREFLRYFLLLDSAMSHGTWARLVPSLEPEYQSIRSILEDDPWRPAASGAPIPFLGLSGGLAGTGFASLRGSLAGCVPFPWFII